jgi:hypothetical protein
MVHSKFNEPVEEEEEEQNVSVAIQLDSEDYKSKLKQILITNGAKGSKKRAIKSKAQEHNLPIEESKAKNLLKNGNINQQGVCCRYFRNVDLLTN